MPQELVFVKKQPNFDNYFKSTKGEVGNYIHSNLGRKVEFLAKAMVGTRSHRLQNSIHITRMAGIKGPSVMVGSPVNYAYWHHEGTKPHVIRANRAQMLHFRVGGRSVFTKQVNHPGTKPNKYLTTPLRTVIR
jgi:hypothetical protein